MTEEVFIGNLFNNKDTVFCFSKANFLLWIMTYDLCGFKKIVGENVI